MHPCISTKTKTRILYSRGMLDGSSTLGKDEHVHKSSFHYLAPRDVETVKSLQKKLQEPIVAGTRAHGLG